MSIIQSLPADASRTASAVRRRHARSWLSGLAYLAFAGAFVFAFAVVLGLVG